MKPEDSSAPAEEDSRPLPTPPARPPTQAARGGSGAAQNRAGQSRGPKKGLSHERRVLLMALAAGLPAIVLALALLWAGGYSAKVFWTLAVMVLGCWLGFSFAVQGRVIRPLQTLANLLAALREGDYSIRARGHGGRDALGEVMSEINELSETLRWQRVGTMEATALLRTVMAEIDVAVFAFDDEDRLRLVNRAGERLLAQPAERLIGRTAAELQLAESLRLGVAQADGTNGDAPHTFERVFPGSANGRWGVRRSSFRQHGRPHTLLVFADLNRPLREEEAKAWQRLVRVLGHELNNSLAPIKSIAGSLTSLVVRHPRPADWQEDVERGLSIVAARAESLSRFMSSYAKLARLPAPQLKPVDIGSVVRRVAELETHAAVELVPGAPVSVRADADQLEQLLINILRNAVDAASATGGGVRLGWNTKGANVVVWVEDEGLGIANPANLFVPFFTTKPEGSGIGLVLSRQIAEAHGGTLTLENRAGSSGCIARLRLPL
ncbi:MAG TPA: ATP-binding protein [Pyrinomonadaceae bacterium]|nr:ATP-binding protein [Pyrinomonadaceae bacterium]